MKNYTKDKKIKRLQDIILMASKGKAVYVKQYDRIIPCAFLQNMHLRTINLLFIKGIYKIKKRKNKKVSKK